MVIDNGDDIMLVRRHELDQEWALVGLGMAGPKNNVAELISLFIGARISISAFIPCVLDMRNLGLV